jgi:O-acetyl-ADP-ribose deacetylase (regulator of RNase III)
MNRRLANKRPCNSIRDLFQAGRSTEPLTFELRDVDSDVVRAWQKYFKGIATVQEKSADAIVSPANSFGYMDGGIDLIYLHRFGYELQTRLQAHLRDEHDGELPVGQATIVETFDAKIPYLVSAPTIRIPMNVSDTINAYLAFRAAILAVKQHNRQALKAIRTILCPGLCTAIGRMPPDLSGRQMAAAFEACSISWLAPAVIAICSGRDGWKYRSAVFSSGSIAPIYHISATSEYSALTKLRTKSHRYRLFR